MGVVATFCLIHGHWHDGSCWSTVAALLRSSGHGVAAPDMPFDAPHTYRDRARPAFDAVAAATPPVVIVGHSVASAEAALVASDHAAHLVVYLCPRMGEYPAPDGAPDVTAQVTAAPDGGQAVASALAQAIGASPSG